MQHSRIPTLESLQFSPRGDSSLQEQLEIAEAALVEARQVEVLRAEVHQLKQQASDEDEAMDALQDARAHELDELARHRRTCADLEARLLQQQRADARQQSSTKLLQLQFNIASQIYELSEAIMAQPAAEKNAWVPTALHEREREVDTLKKALKQQQRLTHEAQQQVLEMTRRKKSAAVGTRAEETESLRAALLEQEIARVAAEARADQLEGQVRLLEEQALRRRLHPVPRQDHEQEVIAKPAARVIIPCSPGKAELTVTST